MEAFLFGVARNIEERQQFIIFIALTFFLAGLARLCSTLLVGNPGNILLGAMIIEFILPIALYFLLLIADKNSLNSCKTETAAAKAAIFLKLKV
jgi:hypothetical protein